MSSVRTTCPYCGVGCGVLATADGVIAGDPEHPANFGRLCSKGAALGETLGSEGRLLQPHIAGRPASWEAALDTIADRFARTIAAHGPDAVALYVSGQFLTEDYYVANKLMKGFVGSANIDTNSRLCMASSVAGHQRAFGADVVPGVYEDWDEADLVILVGSNAAWCHPVLFQRLIAARAQRGTRVIVIDPRRTATCEGADLHLALRPGSDVALFAGLVVHLADAGTVATTWVEQHTSGFAAALATARQTAGTVGAVAAITGLPEADIAAFYDDFARTERVMTVYSQGVNQSSSGTDKVNAIINCHLTTGRIGRPGMGPFSVTGQPNAMGGREVGGLANQLAAHMPFDDPAAPDRVRRFWRAPRLATRPGLKAIDLFDAVLDGRVKALWIMATNPAASMPDAPRVRAALEACPFVALSDCSAWSDTARYADVMLPAAAWGEKDGTVTNSERRISRQRAFRPAMGEARPDWWALSEVARRLGWEAAFPYRCVAEILREHAALSTFENDGSRLFDIGALAGLSDEAYERMAPVQWPLPRGQSGGGRLFGDGRFGTADQRARFVATAWQPPSSAPDPSYPLVLNTGRVRDQWHTMTRTGTVPRLMTHADGPVLCLHPEDAARFEIDAGDLVAVESRFGETIMPARIAPEQRSGEVFAPIHWNDWFTSSGPIARIVGGAVDPISGQPELKATPVRLRAIRMTWRGLLLRRRAGPVDGDFYWARVPLDGGVAFELGGWAALPEGAALEAWATALLGAPAEAERLDYADPARGLFRWASIREGRLDGCLFLSSAGGLPERATLAAFLARPLGDDERLGLLAGRPAGAPASQGPIVCSCFAVGLRTLHRAIREDGLSSVDAIGAALKAGTNCGSCIPELKQILRDADTPAVSSHD